MKSSKHQVPPSHIFTFLANQPGKGVKASKSSTSDGFSQYFSSNEHYNFLYVYFWFAYHLLLAPFRFRKVGEGQFELYKWFPQQILCGIANGLSALKLVTTLRYSVETIKSNDPISFFLVFCECSSVAFKLTILKGFWLKPNAYLRLIRFLSNHHLLPYNPWKIQSITTISIFCAAYTILSIVRMILGSSFLSIWDWSPSWWFRRLVGEAHYTFFLVNGTSRNNSPDLSQISSGDTFLAIIQALIMQSRFITGFFVDLAILVNVLSLWAPASGFTNKICSQISIIHEKDGDLPFDLGASTKTELNYVLKQFEALKTLSTLIGEALGDAILPFIGEALFYYAIYFDDLLMTPDYVNRLVLIFFYCSAICILLFSAEVVRKIRWFRTWLCEHGRLLIIEQNQLAMVLEDITHHSVGITASGIFTINYHFVGTVNTIAFISIMCTTYTILAILRMVLGAGFLEFSDLSPTWWYRRLVGEARYTFFITNVTDIHSAPELHEITPTDKILVICQALMAQSRYITGFYADLLIIVHILTLWAPSTAFADAIYSHIESLKLKRRNQQPQLFLIGVKTQTVTTIELFSVQKRFDVLKSLSILISQTVGDTILPYFGEVLFYYGIFFDDLILTPDIVTVFFCSTCCALTLSANIVRRVSC
ncbi:unnamed protein product [Orchesella dallaii]|uniref:Gustatory receptor n=1 Tax=Orchesella dallaii TaxID=48710 RepID=A0ABP1Q855_9HEXA